MRELKKEFFIVFVFFAVVGVFCWGNLYTKYGDIIEDFIIAENAPSIRMQKEVKTFFPNIKISDELIFGISFPERITKKDLFRIKEISDAVEKFFYPASVQSLATFTQYKIEIKDGIEEDISDFYINDNLLENKDKWSLFDWKKEVLSDENVKDILIGKNFNYALIIVYLQEPFDAVELKSKVSEFLEKRKVPIWFSFISSIFSDNTEKIIQFLEEKNLIKWVNYLKSDIYPAEEYQDLFATGWPLLRPLMTAALIVTLLAFSAVGIILSAWFAYIILHSKRQVLLLMIIIISGFIVIRGGIGLMQNAVISGFTIFLFFDKPIMERVYIMLAFTSNIIAGNSFALRKLETYNEIRELKPELSRKEIWRLAQAVDGRIFLIMLIAANEFASQYQIDVRGLMEVGVLSFILLIFLFFACVYFLPSMDTIIGGEEKKEKKKSFLAKSINKLVEKYPFLRIFSLDNIIKQCYKTVTYYPYKKARKKAFLAVLIPLLGVIMFVGIDLSGIKPNYKYISTNTNPLEYIFNTFVYHSAKFLNQFGNIGFGISKIVVAPLYDKEKDKERKDIYDPIFLQNVDDFANQIKGFEKVNAVKTNITTLSKISEIDYGRKIPEKKEEIEDIYDSMSRDLGPQQQSFFWSDKAMVIFIFHNGDSTDLMNDIHNKSIALAEKKYFDKFEIFLPGKSYMYARGDYYIVKNTPINMLMNWLITALICMSWISFVNISNGKREHQYTLNPLIAGILIMVPFVFASSKIILIMIIFRIPLDQATACINPLSLNAAIDFNIYLIADYHLALISGMNPEEALHYSLRTKGKLILLDVIINAICFLPLNVAPFIPIKRLGGILAVTLLFNGFAALVIMPMMLSWAVKKKENAKSILFLYLVNTYQKMLDKVSWLKKRQDIVIEYYQISTVKIKCN